LYKNLSFCPVQANNIVSIHNFVTTFSNPQIYDFPKHWPRNDRGATIVPVNGENRKRIEQRFYMQPGTEAALEVESVEELCNFNVYEEFTL
jgi:hypothetical protein